MGLYSFTNLLSRWIHHAEVPEGETMRILEWGPGSSTMIMLNQIENCEIWTYENEEKWYDFWKVKLPEDERIHLFHIPLDEGYIEAPRKIGHKFHFIFVDGRSRVKCLEVARDLLTDGGYVLLHDSSRKEYAPGKALFDIVVERDDTAVMVKKLSKKRREPDAIFDAECPLCKDKIKLRIDYKTLKYAYKQVRKQRKKRGMRI